MEILCLILFTVIAFFIAPFLSFLGGWIVGNIITITIGGSIVNGLALLNLNVPLERLPIFFGTIAVIASFFKTYITNFSKSY